MSSISLFQTQTQRRVWPYLSPFPTMRHVLGSHILKLRCMHRKAVQCSPVEQDKINYLGPQNLDCKTSMVRNLTLLTWIKKKDTACSTSAAFLKSATVTLFGTPQVTLLRATHVVLPTWSVHRKSNCTMRHLAYFFKIAIDTNLHLGVFWFFSPFNDLYQSCTYPQVPQLWKQCKMDNLQSQGHALVKLTIFAQTKVILLFHYGQSEIIQFARLTIRVYSKLYNSHVHIWNHSNSNKMKGVIFASLASAFS